MSKGTLKNAVVSSLRSVNASWSEDKESGICQRQIKMGPLPEQPTAKPARWWSALPWENFREPKTENG